MNTQLCGPASLLSTRLILVVLLCGAVGCDVEPPARGAASEEQVVLGSASHPATAEEAEAVAEQAEPVASALMATLSGRLQAAIREQGTAGALEFCNVQALPLTEQVSQEHGMAVTRTSLRLRNPANAPDDVDAEALAWFQDRLATGEPPPAMHVRAVGDRSYRYYRPLLTAGQCLQCHGPRESMADDVLQALDEQYPEDEAVGYTEGEWRGLLRVSVPETAAPGSQ